MVASCGSSTTIWSGWISTRTQRCCLPSPWNQIAWEPIHGATIETLTACPVPITKCRRHPKPRTSLPHLQHTASAMPPAFVDLQDDYDYDNEHKTLPSGSNKRTHIHIANGHCVFHQLGSLKFFTWNKTRNMDGRVLVEIGRPRTRNELRLHQVLTSKDLLSTPFAWHQSNLADPPKIWMSFCLLSLLLQICRSMHLYHMIPLSLIRRLQQHVYVI